MEITLSEANPEEAMSDISKKTRQCLPKQTEENDS